MNLKQIKQNNEADKEYSLVLLVKEIYRTTDGLNIFTVSDDDTTFKLTIFTPGKAAYEHVVKGDIKEFTFKTKIFQGALQGDLKNVIDVNSELVEKFNNQLNDKNKDKYAPVDSSLLITTKSFEDMKPSMIKASSVIRQAVIEKRPIHITHHADCDGFSAGILLEKSIMDLIKQTHPHERYIRQYISRNPSKPPYYDLPDATKDIGFFIGNTNRFGVVSPLIIIVDNGSTHQDLISIEKVKLYGADVVVIDHHDPGVLDEAGKSLICKHTLAHVNPHLQGYKEGLSASMLCYQVAHFITNNYVPSVFAAAAGGVADRCQSEEINFLIEKSNYDREYLRNLGIVVDYEIFMTKMNLQAGAIYTLLVGEDEKRTKLISLYEPILARESAAVKLSLKKYAQEVQWGKHKVVLVNGEETTLWGDYYSIGKLAGITFDLFEPTLVIVYSNSMMVFRAQQDSGFDVNKLLSHLKETLPHTRISGGGHAVAGSLKFLSAAKKELLDSIQEKLQE